MTAHCSPPLSPRSPPQPPSSSSPPLTPPPLNHAASPYSRAPLPTVCEHGDYCHRIPVSINPILTYSCKPTVSFNLLLHPSAITSLPEHRSLAYRTLSEPATNPPLPCITITSPYLQWSITVLPSSHRPNKCVTVSDVLVTLHRTLGLAATRDEYTSLQSDEVTLRVNAAYEQRLAAIPDWRARETERCVGVKRIDFLMGHTRFLGLSRMGRLPDVLVLNVF